MTRVAMCAALLSSLVAAAASAQVRDVSRPSVGTASISGVVTTDGPAPRGIRRVIVQLTEVTSGRPPIAAITDDAGVFAFRDLGAGTYTMVAVRPPYLSSAYGAKTQGRGSGVPINVGPGQHITDINLKMTRGGVLAGTLRDQDGNPAPNVELMLLVAKTDGGRKRYNPVPQSSRTDARGQFRAYGLLPGDYVVRAQPQNRGPELYQGSTSGRTVTYATSYYPGTTDASTATVITLGAGEERAGIDFSLALVPTSEISGRLIGPDGQPPKNASLSLEPLGTATPLIDALIGMAQTGSMGFGGGRADADGMFTLRGIQPGRYRISARGSLASAAANPAAGAMGALGGMMPGLAGAMGASLWASDEIAVDGRDVTVNLQLQDGLTMAGTIVFDGPAAAPAQDPSKFQISLMKANSEAASAMDLMLSAISGLTPGRAAKDGTFTVNGIVPGRYRFTAGAQGAMGIFGLSSATPPAPDAWILKSVMWHGRDLADGTIDIRSTDDLSGVVVTFTKVVTELSGRILNAAGQPAPGFPIVVFSTTPSDWSAGSRRVTSVKPSTDGNYRVRGLPPGEYYMCALADLDPNDTYDPAFLEQLAASSFKISLGEGEKKTQDLKIGGGGNSPGTTTFRGPRKGA